MRFGNSQTLCNAAAGDEAPIFPRRAGNGWTMVEYGSSLRPTREHEAHESSQCCPSFRARENRLATGHPLRTAVEIRVPGGRQTRLHLDMVRTAAGSAAAAGARAVLGIAADSWLKTGSLRNPGEAVLYGTCGYALVPGPDCPGSSEVAAGADLVPEGNGGFAEVQMTAENIPFSDDTCPESLELSKKGVGEHAHRQCPAPVDP